ncbi:MAG TPA: 50S ribosomal protein L20 [Bacteroidetes bacterium]|nr:50S ribosomal protein L20 [Bacteroidota bacterium]
MPRATNNPTSRRRRKKVLNRAKGFFGRGKNTIRAAKRLTDKAAQYSYIHRRQRRREFRRLWITRINAAVRDHGMSYSVFMHKLDEKGIDLDRKALAHLAFHDPEAFAQVVARVQG